MQREVQGLIPDQICMVSFKLEKKKQIFYQNDTEFLRLFW